MTWRAEAVGFEFRVILGNITRSHVRKQANPLQNSSEGSECSSVIEYLLA